MNLSNPLDESFDSSIGQLGNNFIVVNEGIPVLSSDVITDTQRTAALGWTTTQSGGSVDQYPVPDGTSIWRSGTNIFGYGQVGSGATTAYPGTIHSPYSAYGTTTVTRDATTAARFSTESIKVNIVNQNQSGVQCQTISGSYTVNTTIATSIYIKGTAGTSYKVQTILQNSDNTSILGSAATVTGTGNWQYVAPGTATVSVGKTTSYPTVAVYQNNGASNTSDTFWVAHPMIESGINVSPYIATMNGSKASRSAGRIQLPSSLIDETMGWVATVFKIDYNPSIFNNVVNNTLTPFRWGDDPVNTITCRFIFDGVSSPGTVSSSLQVFRSAGGSTNIVTPISFSAGDTLGFLFYWTATQIGLSVNGGTFTTAVNTKIPALAASSFDIGSDQGSGHVNANFLWAVCGLGSTPTQADVSTLWSARASLPTSSSISVPATVVSLYTPSRYSNNSTYSVSNQTHRDIRTFDSNNNHFRTTMADLAWYNVNYLGGSGTAHNFSVGQLQNSYQSGHSWPNLENWVLQSYNVAGSQVALTDSPQAFPPLGGGTVTARIGPSTSNSYGPTLNVTLSGSAPQCKLISPSGTLDMLTGLNDPTTEYDVTFMVRGVPPQTNPLHFDLTSSLVFIDNKSNQSSIPFTTFANLLSPSSTSDVQVRFNRNLLTGIDLTKITDVRLMLKTQGSGIFTSEFQDFRVVPSGTFTNPFALINTQTKRLTANSESLGGAPVNLFFTTARPKNLKQNIRFNTGTSPAIASGTNQITGFYRYSSVNSIPSYISTTITSSGGTTNVNLYQTISGTTNFVGNFSSSTLSGSTDYVLVTTLKGNRGQVELFNVNGAFLGSRIGTTGNKLLPIDQGTNKRGLVGFNFNPYNHDFQIAEITMQRAEFGTMMTTPALSFKPVRATQLFTNTSGPITLMDSTNITSFGDATLAINSNSGDPAPDYILTRSGTNTNITPMSSWSGGVISSGTFYLHDPNEAYLAGSIYPYVTGAATSTTYSGTFQVGLINKDNAVGYIATIPDIVGGQWNNFVIPLNLNVVSGKYYIVIRNVGYYGQRFEVDNISLYHNTVSWSAANDGENFIPFYDNINNQYSMISFPGQHPQIQVRAAALSDTNAWIESWVDKPIYQE